MYSIVAEESGLLPRERLLQKGAEVLSDQELLAIVPVSYTHLNLFSLILMIWFLIRFIQTN